MNPVWGEVVLQVANNTYSFTILLFDGEMKQLTFRALCCIDCIGWIDYNGYQAVTYYFANTTFELKLSLI